MTLKGRQRSKLVQRFLNIRDGCLRKRFPDLGDQSILNLLMQCRADLAQGLGVGDEDKGRKVSVVGTAIELVCELFCERGLVSFLGDDSVGRLPVGPSSRRWVGLNSPSANNEILCSSPALRKTRAPVPSATTTSALWGILSAIIALLLLWMFHNQWAFKAICAAPFCTSRVVVR